MCVTLLSIYKKYNDLYACPILSGRKYVGLCLSSTSGKQGQKGYFYSSRGMGQFNNCPLLARNRRLDLSKLQSEKCQVKLEPIHLR